MSDSGIRVKFIGGPLNEREEVLEDAYPRRFARLREHSFSAGFFESADAHPSPESVLEYEELEYWLVPKRDGTWMAFEKPVWDEVQELLRQQDERERRLRQKVHDALDRMLGW